MTYDCEDITQSREGNKDGQGAFSCLTVHVPEKESGDERAGAGDLLLGGGSCECQSSSDIR